MIGRKKRGIPLSVYLSYLLVATLLVTGVTFSGYITTATGGDEARVAMVVLDSGMTYSDTLSFSGYPGISSKAIPIDVSNYESEEKSSEVALDYSIQAENITNNIPGLSFEFYDNEQCSGEAKESISGSFAAGQKEAVTCYLKINWPESNGGKDYDASYAFEIDALRIIISAEQVD